MRIVRIAIFLLFAFSFSGCGKAIFNAQNYNPNKPPIITNIVATNVDGSPINSTTISGFSTYSIIVTASDPDNQSLNYSFSSPSGSFKNLSATSTGCTVQFVTGNVRGGTKVVVSVSASDSVGGVAGRSLDVGTGKLGPSISVAATRTRIKSTEDTILSITSNCNGIYQILPNDTTANESTTIKDAEDVMIYNGKPADITVTGPASTSSGIAKLPSIAGRTAGVDYNDTFSTWIVFRDSLMQTTAVKCPITVDDVPPKVTCSLAGTSVAKSSSLFVLTFSEEIPASSMESASVVLTDSSGTVIPVTLTGHDTTTATYSIGGPLEYGMSYDITVSGIADAGGLVISAGTKCSFKVVLPTP
ncbi:MAG TPA: Ig-like domain-containing protein, partial [Spirochaetota bacterium]